MPSNRTPGSVVHPGPGRAVAGTITASSMISRLVGSDPADARDAIAIAALEGTYAGITGSVASVQNGITAFEGHITDPTDAHMAGAVGIPAIDPTTGEPMLASAGGFYVGESVLDALVQIKELDILG